MQVSDISTICVRLIEQNAKIILEILNYVEGTDIAEDQEVVLWSLAERTNKCNYPYLNYPVCLF